VWRGAWRPAPGEEEDENAAAECNTAAPTGSLGSGEKERAYQRTRRRAALLRALADAPRAVVGLASACTAHDPEVWTT